MLQQGQPAREILKMSFLFIFCLLNLESLSINSTTPLNAKYSKQELNFLFTQPVELLSMSQHGQTYMQSTQNNLLFIFCLLNLKSLCMFQHSQPTRTIFKRILCLFTVH